MRVIDTAFDPAMERGIKPVTGAFNQTMLHRIVMNVIEMPLIMPFVAQNMIPKPPLPHAPAAMA